MTRAPEMRMAAIAVAFAAGIVAADRLAFASCLVIAAAVLLLSLAFLREPTRSTSLILACVFVLGAGRYAAARRPAPDDISRFHRNVTAFGGVVASDPEPVGDHFRLVVRAEQAEVSRHRRRVSGCVMVNLYAAAPTLQYGARVRLRVRPYLPMEPTNPGQFSWKDYLARQGIYACASIRHPMQVELLPGRKGNLPVRGAIAAKHHISQAISRTHPEEEASVIAGVVLGTYTYLPKRMFKDFSRTGTLHILAASGYNCFILLAISAPLLRRLGLLPKWRSLVVILLIAGYVLMVGPKPSLVRAAVMASLFLLAMPLKRAANFRNVFFAAAVVVLAMNPSELFDVGFQLSFLSVWALISVGPMLWAVLHRAGLVHGSPNPRRRWIHRSLAKLAGTISAAAIGTTAISLVTAPIVAHYFNYVSLVSIPANIALALGVPLVFADGFASAALAPLGPLGGALGWLGTQVTRAMLAVVGYFGSLSWAAKSVPSPGVLAIAGYYLVLYAILAYVKSRTADA